jgi:hypothetical protein
MASGHVLENGSSIGSADVLQEHDGADDAGPLLLGIAPKVGTDAVDAIFGPPRAILGEEVKVIRPAEFPELDILAFPGWVRFVRGENTVTRFRGAPPSGNLAEDDVNPVCRAFQPDVRLESPTYLRLATVSQRPGLAESPVSSVKRSRTKRVCNVGTRVAQSDCRVLTPRCEPSRLSRPAVACGSVVTCSLKQ